MSCPGYLGPDQQGGGVLLCFQRIDPGKCPKTEVTVWATAAEAQQAERELSPCGPKCAGNHLVVVNDGGEARVLRRTPELPPLAKELAELYNRRTALDGVPPEYWDMPEEFNEPLVEREPQASALAEAVGRGQRVALAQMLAEVPRISTLPDETAAPGVVAPGRWDGLPPLITSTPVERFALAVYETDDGHHLWCGTTGGDGTPYFWDGRVVSARRWSYEQAYGAIPANRHLHGCEQEPLCVNATHLRLPGKEPHMSLSDRARAARAAADCSTDRGVHAVANALEAAQRAEEDTLLADALHQEPDLTGLSPESEGYPSEVWIQRTEN
jgi:hypothetical protein